MRRRDAVRMQHTDRVGNKIGTRVARAPRLVADRTTGVAMVVANHEPTTVGEHPAEPLIAPEHRGGDTHDQKDRRVSRVAQRLRAELDPVRLDHPLSHLGR
jgi:hypothetical protein